mgnify:CR=1 FL=1
MIPAPGDLVTNDGYGFGWGAWITFGSDRVRWPLREPALLLGSVGKTHTVMYMNRAWVCDVEFGGLVITTVSGGRCANEQEQEAQEKVPS